MTMKVAVIIPAAGASRRFHGADPGAGADKPSKIELDLAGKPVFLRSVELFQNRSDVVRVILAVSPERLELTRMRWGDKLSFHGVKVVEGGRKERWETVLKALEAVDAEATHVAIHDAARPLASNELIDRVFEAAARHDAVIPGLAVSATLKRVQDVALPADAAPATPLDAILGEAAPPLVQLRQVTATVDRTDLVEVQTPQVFALPLLRRAYEQITSGKLSGAGITDDAGLVEALGEPVMVVPGEMANFKITRPEDLALAALIAAGRDSKQAVSDARKRLFGDDE